MGDNRQNLCGYTNDVVILKIHLRTCTLISRKMNWMDSTQNGRNRKLQNIPLYARLQFYCMPSAERQIKQMAALTTQFDVHFSRLLQC